MRKKQIKKQSSKSIRRKNQSWSISSDKA